MPDVSRWRVQAERYRRQAALCRAKGQHFRAMQALHRRQRVALEALRGLLWHHRPVVPVLAHAWGVQ